MLSRSSNIIIVTEHRFITSLFGMFEVILYFIIFGFALFIYFFKLLQYSGDMDKSHPIEKGYHINVMNNISNGLIKQDIIAIQLD